MSCALECGGLPPLLLIRMRPRSFRQISFAVAQRAALPIDRQSLTADRPANRDRGFFKSHSEFVISNF